MKISWALPAFSSLDENQDGYLFELFHENSKLFGALVGNQAAPFTITPFDLYITSRGFRQYGEVPRIPLPEMLSSGERISDVMLRRRSIRQQGGIISISHLGTL